MSAGNNRSLSYPMFALYVLVFFFISILGCEPCGAGSREEQSSSAPRLMGAKIYEYGGDAAELFRKWRSYGLNTVFIGEELAQKQDFIPQARRHGVFTFVILPIFQDPAALADNPDLCAINGYGKAAKQEWVEFVCPSRDEFRAQKLATMERIVREYDPDGISIDFIRFFVFWEKVYPGARLDRLENTCFCPRCLVDFQKAADCKIPKELTDTTAKASWILDRQLKAWVRWKCGVITSMVKDITRTARAVKPGIKINIHLVPWRAGDFGNARMEVTGQDIAALSEFADYLSPMCYAHMVKQTPEWIGEVMQDMAKSSSLPLLPSIQVKKAYLETELPGATVVLYLKEALQQVSAGVVYWDWAGLEPWIKMGYSPVFVR